MKQLQTGEFYGQTNQTIHLNGITLTDTEYTLDFVDWHYHENAYFTFILEGNVIEGNKKEVYNCSAGTLLFHNWQEPHYNIKPEGYTRGFQIELKNTWFDQWDFNMDSLQGSLKISNVDVKLLIYKIVKETKIEDNTNSLSIQSMLLEALSVMFRSPNIPFDKDPIWVRQVKEILFYEFSDKLTLDYLSKTLDIHPVHLSRDFSKYFHCNLGEYIRKLKIEKSYNLLSNKQLSLTEIAYECGFSDQSHFNRCFKSESGISPNHFRKMIAS
ncbi:helix-turn-helix domain-containing protein [Fluviicola taffensis]|uniref:Transcriptional regulator, AraC family n=1 Tax=Fluviicola taffensis (strain DSM 16823 / NCIMB 13979 / RW262) TaxID=755732 RepID=F2I9Q9_FLUTR|nr:AraC family transcriptional regulator [Fluviicola taffensis]AEA43055.1 transcriptional regulator, AraC family [Fluviicola taffensis DSM 16823]